jgi:N6-L-threonylcarbamoyladenine synthase
VNKAIQSLPVAVSGTTFTKIAPAAEAGTVTETHGGTCENPQITLGNGSIRRRPDFISVTRGPGMRSNLDCGLNIAKGLAVAWQVPLLGLHHMQAHALTPRLVHALDTSPTKSSGNQPAFPFLSLLVSGGHTQLIQSKGLTEHKLIATSHDLAIGNALDLMGRIVLPDSIQGGLKDVAYGKHLSAYAFPTTSSYNDYEPPANRGVECVRAVNEYGWAIPVPLSLTRRLCFSFSGIVTSMAQTFPARAAQPSFSNAEREAFARSALISSFNHLASRTVIALEKLQKEGQPIGTLVVSGGVAASEFLRHVLRRFLNVRGFQSVELKFPPAELCTDNAAMIAWCGLEMFEAGWRTKLDCRSVKRWSMDAGEVSQGGGNRDSDGDGDDVDNGEGDGDGSAGGGAGGGGGIVGLDGWYNVLHGRPALDVELSDGADATDDLQM